MDPWCLVGIKQFLVALSVYNDQHPRSRLIPSVRLMPYCLNPYLTTTPIPRREHRTIIFGEEEYLLRQLPRWVAKMRDLGYEPADDSTAWAASSHATQRLLSYCLLIHPERQLGLAMDIYEQYHVGGRHCSDLHMLAELGRRHGVFGSTAEAMQWLSGTELDREVQRAYVTAKRLGVSGVPFFVFQDKWAASGAMGVDRFVQVSQTCPVSWSRLGRRPRAGATRAAAGGGAGYILCAAPPVLGPRIPFPLRVLRPMHGEYKR